MDIDEREWAGEQPVEELKEGRFPVVFAFRPTKFLRVTPDKVAEWEQLFVDNVGARFDREAAQLWTGDPRETISGSNDGWDDCDCW